LVGYPILDLRQRGRDLHCYLRSLEDLLIDLLKEFGIRGDKIAGKTGVWVQDRKIASIGVGVRKWFTMHGFALNVASDLSGFQSIVPCGLPGVRMTSISTELATEVSLKIVREKLTPRLGQFLGGCLI
jgi:lipoyl(octanoyl) transferase